MLYPAQFGVEGLDLGRVSDGPASGVMDGPASGRGGSVGVERVAQGGAQLPSVLCAVDGFGV